MRLCALYHDVPVARRYRAENDRTNVANKVSCFPTCTRERERDGETRAGYFKVASLQRWPLNVVACCLWSTLGPEIVYLSLREKPPFCIPRDPLAVTTCFSLFPRNLFTVITYSRDWGSLHCCPRHYPTLFNRPHSFRGNFPRDLCTRLTSSNPWSFPG